MTVRRAKTGFAISLAAAFIFMVPALLPRFVMQNPNVMYAVAYYKVATGQPEDAARLVAEAGKKSREAQQTNASRVTMTSARTCTAADKS